MHYPCRTWGGAPRWLEDRNKRFVSSPSSLSRSSAVVSVRVCVCVCVCTHAGCCSCLHVQLSAFRTRCSAFYLSLCFFCSGTDKICSSPLKSHGRGHCPDRSEVTAVQGSHVVILPAHVTRRCAVTPLKNAPLGSVRYMWEKDGTPYANTQW